MRTNYIILAAALALSCAPRPKPLSYAEEGRLNFTGGAWEPAAVAVGPDGRVYVADISFASAVQVFDDRGVYLGAIGRAGDAPGELLVPTDVAASPANEIYAAEFGTRRVSVFAPDGRVFVADADAGGVVVFSRQGERLATWGVKEGVAKAWDVACGTEGRVAVAEADTGEVVVLKNDGRVITRLNPTHVPDFVAVEVAFGPGGGIYVLGRYTGPAGAQEYSVAVFDTDYRMGASFDVDLTSPAGLAVAPDGRVYVTDGPRHEVKIYKPASPNS